MSVKISDIILHIFRYVRLISLLPLVVTCTLLTNITRYYRVFHNQLYISFPNLLLATFSLLFQFDKILTKSLLLFSQYLRQQKTLKNNSLVKHHLYIHVPFQIKQILTIPASHIEQKNCIIFTAFNGGFKDYTNFSDNKNTTRLESVLFQM